ncbi:hypothetical protein [Citrobacter meridianamericanus]|uniref:hypothetical protein n=1 Tax=Citrobacter meridianamericanus TaxID=2894201 RepID=UPI00351CE88D
MHSGLTIAPVTPGSGGANNSHGRQRVRSGINLPEQRFLLYWPVQPLVPNIRIVPGLYPAAAQPVIRSQLILCVGPSFHFA